MGITGSQPAYSMAQGGVMRGSSSRGNVHTPFVFVAIDGVQYATARANDDEQVDNETLSIAENEGETPNTASFQTRGFQPTDGQDVVITQGSINNLQRLFAGTVMTDSHSSVGSPANGRDQVNIIDYTWQLTRGTISRRWTNVSGTVIAQEIIADLGRGFSAEYVEADLPVIDEFSVTNQTHAKALGSLCERIGASYWIATYYKTIWLGLGSDPNETNPTELTDASALLTEMTDLVVTRDLGQVITRQPVEGGGSNAYANVAPGATILPVEDDAFYNPLGGTVVSGPQRITYTGLSYGYTPEIGNWHAQAPASLSQSWSGVVWAEALGLFVAVSQISNLTAVMTSPDGFLWTTRAPAVASTWRSVAWSPDLGLLCAVSSNGLVMTSPNGITWTQRTAAEDSAWWGIVWAPGLALFVVVAASVATGTHQVMTSPDGITWTARTAASALAWDRVTWAPSLGLLVATASSGGTDAIMTSPDGTTWTARTTPQAWSAVAWSPPLNLFVTVAGTATATSPDGITWTSHASALPANLWKAIIWSDLGFFVALSDGTTDNIAVSIDGLTWTLYTAPANVAASGRWALAWSPTLGRLVAVGFNGSLVGRLITNSAIVYPTLTGIPASGAGAILYTIQQGDQVNLRVVVDDLAAQAVLAALLDDDGIIEGAVIQDGRISETEALARGEAQLALRKDIAVTAGYTTHDINTHASREISFDLDQIEGTLRLQSVTIDNFHPSRWQTHKAQASSKRFSLEMLLRLARSTP